MSGSYGKTRFATILFDAYGTLYDVQGAMRAKFAAFLGDRAEEVRRLWRAYKPASAMYQLGIDAFRLDKDDILFVSSNAWDVAGAKLFGYPS